VLEQQQIMHHVYDLFPMQMGDKYDTNAEYYYTL
jgi:hypothetical protein